MAQIPSLGFSIRNALDRLAWQHNIYNQEFVQRMLLMFGHPDYFTNPAYGVVSEPDPTSAVAGGTYPLTVSANVLNQLNVDVNPGMAVTRSGMWMLLPDFARNIALADPTVNIPNVVYMTYKLVDGPLEKNDEQRLAVTFTQRPEDDPDVSVDFLISVDTVANYLTVQPSVLADRVPLCVVTVVTQEDPGTGGTVASLSFDHTRLSYVWNRPWFSAVDIEHRSKVGTGEITDQNTHGLSLNEVSVGPFGPLELQAPHGMFISKPQSIEKVPGYSCEEAIPTSQLQTDDSSGTKTGFPGAVYIELVHYPARVGQVTLKSTGDDFPSIWVPETNRIAFPVNKPPPGDSVITRYTRVEACEPPLRGATSFTTSNPKSQEELIIAGGGGISALASTEETFADAHQVPMRYVMFVDKQGNLVKTPQVIFCYTRLETIATTATPDIEQYGNAIIMMALTGAAPVGTMEVEIRVYGEDPDGNSIDHLFAFDGATWSDPGPAPKSTLVDAGFKMSTQLFSKITSVEIEKRKDDGTNSAIMIWACLNPIDTRTEMEQAAVVSEVFYDGLMLSDVRDKRIILSTTRDFLLQSDGRLTLEAYIRTLGGNITTMYVDDFRIPQLGSLERPREFLSTNEANYPWATIDQLYTGRQGVYQTRSLPIFKNSGNSFRLIMLPQGLAQQPFKAPQIRFFDGTTWTAFSNMSAVPGIPHAYDATSSLASPQGLQVRVFYDTYYQSHLMSIHGIGA